MEQVEAGETGAHNHRVELLRDSAWLVHEKLPWCHRHCRKANSLRGLRAIVTSAAVRRSVDARQAVAAGLGHFPSACTGERHLYDQAALCVRVRLMRAVANARGDARASANI